MTVKDTERGIVIGSQVRLIMESQVGIGEVSSKCSHVSDHIDISTESRVGTDGYLDGGGLHQNDTWVAGSRSGAQRCTLVREGKEE